MSWPATLRDTRMLALAGALILAALAAIGYSYQREQNVVDAIAVIDITGSMNARDGAGAAGTKSRIDAARDAILDLTQRLPCRSRLGLGIFTERRSFLLFGPADICENYDALEGALQQLDWRMAWEGDSFIAKGLYSAVEIAADLKSDVIFFTDGHEAPPLPASGIPDFEGKVGDVKGLVVGVGGSEKIPIPKYDDDGREIGVYGVHDVPHVNRHGLPPKGAEAQPGWHPRNAPFGGEELVGEEHLTSMRADYLKEIAGRTGLKFIGLSETGSIVRAVLDSAELRPVRVATSASPIPATLALMLAAVAYGLSLLPRSKGRRRNVPILPAMTEV